MIRKQILTLMLVLLTLGGTALAIPAYNRSRNVVQPDGSTITLVAHGDEYGHYLTTTDGTVVVKHSDGFYRPAVSQNKSAIVNETSLARLEPVTVDVASRPYRGLVVLVNFNDRKFSRGDESAHKFYDRLMNKHGFTYDIDSYYGIQYYTGSVYDYFNDNSYGAFQPEFDVVGPVNVDFSQYNINGVENSFENIETILRQIDKDVDFSRYDSDGDGIVDMVYVIYAGYSSHYQDNDVRYVWPHAGSMMNRSDGGDENIVLDGKRVGRYACSAEIFGWEDDEDVVLDGIGVIVHEFSHVLGFQDHYDSSNGYQEHPNDWDIMAAGSYSEDFNRTPCGFNSFEKVAAGFIPALDITDMDGATIKMKSTEKSTDACVIRSYQEHVLYMMENRQPDKWDVNLPGHGMLVWRIDSTNVDYWTHNALNVTTRACFRLVRAKGTQGSFMTGVVDTDYDSFPGTQNVTELDNDLDDDANLISYDQYPTPVVLRNIAETDGVVSFDVEYDPEARNSPITFRIPEILYAHAERLEEEQWVEVDWVVTCEADGDSYSLRNFLPDTEEIADDENGVSVAFRYMDDANHTLQIEAQRLKLYEDYGVWLCDFGNVEQQGTGVISLTVNRYGVPTILGEDVLIGFCHMKPKSYMVSERNMLERTALYRNIVFRDNVDDPTPIEQPITDMPLRSGNGFIYNLGGQRVEKMVPGNIYITNNRKIYIPKH